MHGGQDCIRRAHFFYLYLMEIKKMFSKADLVLAICGPRAIPETWTDCLVCGEPSPPQRGSDDWFDCINWNCNAKQFTLDRGRPIIEWKGGHWTGDDDRWYH